MQRLPFWIRLTMLAVLVLAVGYSVLLLLEAYGNGPPYFGRTTNMDKWSSPWPHLLVANLIATLVIVILRRIGRGCAPRGDS